jgi:hypothetical protein
LAWERRIDEVPVPRPRRSAVGCRLDRKVRPQYGRTKPFLLRIPAATAPSMSHANMIGT